MAFLTGWVDATNLVKYQCFATMMVGNMSFFAMALGRDMAGTPAQHVYHSAAFYGTLIGSFLIGVLAFRVARQKLKWGARAFAPIVFIWMILVDIVDGFSLTRNSVVGEKVIVILQAPIFGIINSVALKGHYGGLPWGTTGNLINAGYALASLLMGECGTISQKDKMSCMLVLMTMVGGILGTAFRLKFENAWWQFTGIGTCWSILLYRYRDLHPAAAVVKRRCNEDLSEEVASDDVPSSDDGSVEMEDDDDSDDLEVA
mmetsp:Transcript_48080/g.153876  ORF Transcript_48080/g.153876 Transcript_48080/m.153876 type:complete len:259 (-) Transcript_48080:141-917(-)